MGVGFGFGFGVRVGVWVRVGVRVSARQQLQRFLPAELGRGGARGDRGVETVRVGLCA